ncbi:MAG TPA: hypothetical protein VHW68_01560 [Actinomycetota bacterium]|jgi:hypothetical protein|nr:hypothetical protein [Actinomycetota bacterium]
MPGRAFIGLSPDEKHPAEFHPSPLPDEPQITVSLPAGADRDGNWLVLVSDAGVHGV